MTDKDLTASFRTSSSASIHASPPHFTLCFSFCVFTLDSHVLDERVIPLRELRILQTPTLRV